jgi:hypothetical protein
MKTQVPVFVWCTAKCWWGCRREFFKAAAEDSRTRLQDKDKDNEEEELVSRLVLSRLDSFVWLGIF